MSKDNHWVRLYATIDEVLIALLKAKLHDASIPAVELRKKDTVYNVIGDIELMVPQAQYVEAHEILVDFNEELK